MFAVQCAVIETSIAMPHSVTTTLQVVALTASLATTSASMKALRGASSTASTESAPTSPAFHQVVVWWRLDFFHEWHAAASRKVARPLPQAAAPAHARSDKPNKLYRANRRNEEIAVVVVHAHRQSLQHTVLSTQCKILTTTQIREAAANQQ